MAKKQSKSIEQSIIDALTGQGNDIKSPVPQNESPGGVSDPTQPGLDNYYQQNAANERAALAAPAISPTTPTISPIPPTGPTMTLAPSFVPRINTSGSPRIFAHNMPQKKGSSTPSPTPTPQAPAASQMPQGNVFQQFGNAVSTAVGGGWNEFVNAAKNIAQQEGFPLSVILGQAAVETGRSGANAPGNNWFGIKGTGSGGTQNLATQEADPSGNFYNTKSNFAAYQNAADSIKSYINLIKTRYPQAYAQRNNPAAMITAIHQGGYATDPNYAQKVMSTPEFKQNATPPPASHLVNPVYARTFNATPTPVQKAVSNVPQQQFKSPIPQNQIVKQQPQSNIFQNIGNAVNGAAQGIGHMFGM